MKSVVKYHINSIIADNVWRHLHEEYRPWYIRTYGGIYNELRHNNDIYMEIKETDDAYQS